MRPVETSSAVGTRTSALQGARGTRDTAAIRLLEEARALGANAIIGMRYESNAEEVCAYGTAVRMSA